MAPKIKELIPIQEAMDNLAAIAEIDLQAIGPIGIFRGSRIVTDEEEFKGTEVFWLSAEGSEEILDALDATFRSIHQHLRHLTQSPEMNWDDERQIKGIAAMISLAGECAIRMERYLESRLGRKVGKIHDRAEYQALQNFYLDHISKRIKQNEPHLPSDNPMMDIDVVRADRDYELFYIRQDDGTPYFNPDLLRHIRLSCDFESLGETFEEDPLLQVRAMTDRDLQASAHQILSDCHVGIKDFFSSYQKVLDFELAASLSMAITALYLAANPRNLLQNTTGKTCLQYFDDFHRFLRRSMKTDEYQKWIAYPPAKSEKLPNLLLQLVHSLCDSLFHRSGGVKQEAIGLIHRTMRRGEEKGKDKGKKAVDIWPQLSLEDEHFRSLLTKFPNGPLFKVLDLIREEQNENQVIPYDPFIQGNMPCKLFELQTNEGQVEMLRIASPTRQTLINKVEILDEFRGMLRSYQLSKPPRMHLMINLQDRTSWKESGRCHALEALQKNAEFSPLFAMITLPKTGDFYHQMQEYANEHQTSRFLETFTKQIERFEECGYTTSAQFKLKEIITFTKEILPLIHEIFFDRKNTLTRKNREDFIEIYHYFLVLKAIDQIRPDSMSFTGKDSVDEGAALTASFYALVQILTTGFTEKQQQDYFRWLLYVPALFIRERAIDPECLNRSLSALETLSAGALNRLGEIKALYSKQFFERLKI